MERYWRFKDDGLIIFKSCALPEIASFFEDWNRISSWRVDSVTITFPSAPEYVEVVGSISYSYGHFLPYLDLKLSFGENWFSNGHIDVTPYIKPTAVKVPLSYSSAHSHTTKLWWPKAELGRFARNSHDYQSFEHAALGLLSRISKTYPRAYIRSLTDELRDFFVRRQYLLDGRDLIRHREGQSLQVDNIQQQSTMVIKTRFNPHFSNQLASCVRKQTHIMKFLGNRHQIYVLHGNFQKHLRIQLKKTWPRRNTLP